MPRSDKPSVWIEPRKAASGFTTYRVRAEFNGVPLKAIPCGTDIRLARAKKAQLAHDLWSGRLGVGGPSDVTLEAWAKEYLKICREQNEASTVERFDTPAIEAFIAFAGPERRLAGVDQNIVREWKDHLALAGGRRHGKPVPLGPTTIRMRLAHARAGFTWAIKRGWISENPFEAVEMPRSNKRERVLSGAELDIAFDVLPAEHRGWFTVLLWTGLRKDELLGLRWSQVIRGQGDLWRITFKASQTKNHKAKAVELHPSAQAVLEAQAGQGDRVFPSLTDDMVEYWFRRLSARLGPVSPHVLKHTFCTRFMEANGDLDSLCLMTGNSRRSLEIHYIHLSRPRPRSVLNVDFGFAPPAVHLKAQDGASPI